MCAPEPRPLFSDAIERALQASLVAHAGQARKGDSSKPYAVHPLHMALMLARLDMDEVVIQTALLHDVVEDCDGWDAERVEAEFGAQVASAVMELTEDKSGSWAERKMHAIQHVPHLSRVALAVKAIDKLHNIESMVAQLACVDDHADVWKSFNGGRERTLVTSRALVEAICERLDGPLGEALHRAMGELDAIAGAEPR